MTIKFADSFQHYATADLAKKYTSGTAGPVIGAGGRDGGTCLQSTSGSANWTAIQIGGSQDTLIAGVSVKSEDALSGSAALGLLDFWESTSIPHVHIWVNGNGAVVATRINGGLGSGGTDLGSSANGVITAQTWHHISAKVKVHDTAGTVEVWVYPSGTKVLDLAAQDTRNGGTGICDKIAVVGFMSIVPKLTYLSDFYVLDTAGAAPNNTFLGDVRVDALLPTADGNYSQLTPSTGAVHYVLVDEATPNTSDYNSSATSGNRDTYAMADLATSSATYFAVQALVASLKDSASASSAQTCIRSGSTDSVGVSTALATTQSYLRDVYPTDPATSAAWTFAAINAAEAGMNVTVSGASARASQVVLEVVRSRAAAAVSSAAPVVFICM